MEKHTELQQQSKRMLTEVVDERDKLLLQADALQKQLEEERQTGKDDKLKANKYLVMERKLNTLIAEKEEKICAEREKVENLERNLAFEKQAFYDFDKLFDCYCFQKQIIFYIVVIFYSYQLKTLKNKKFWNEKQFNF